MPFTSTGKWESTELAPARRRKRGGGGRARTLRERVAEADARGSNWLALGNEARDAGLLRKAESLYDRARYWLDLSNNLRGCS